MTQHSVTQHSVTLRPATAKLRWYVGGGLFVAACAVLVLVVGQADLPATAVLVEALDRLTPGRLDSGLTSVERSIVWNLRMPRIALGLLVGAALATSGATFQGVFRNPLADPYLLGVAAGGGLGATIAFVTGLGDGQGVLDGVQIAAFIGALASVGVTWVMGTFGDRARQSTSLILAGVAVASFCTALQTYIQQRNTEDIRQIYVWFLGGLTTQGWGEVTQALPLIVPGIAALMMAGRTLDVLGVGDEEATMLGLRVTHIRLLLVAISALVTAAAVAVSGLIAFVGLIVPHTVRLLFGTSYRIVIPMSVLAGAAFLLLCDLAARTLGTASEIPIGVVTAFFGAPFFIAILRTASR